MQVRRKLTEFESTMAFVVGGGLSLIILAFLLASASGANANYNWLNIMIAVGALLMVGGAAVWLFVNKPWTTHDDWSEPLYTGHDHGHDVTYDEPDEEDLIEAHGGSVETHTLPLALAQAEPNAISSPAPSAVMAAMVESAKLAPSAPAETAKMPTPTKFESPVASPSEVPAPPSAALEPAKKPTLTKFESPVASPSEVPASPSAPLEPAEKLTPTKFESPVASPDYAPNLPAFPQTPAEAPASAPEKPVKTNKPASSASAKPAEKSAPTKFESPVPSPDYAPNLPAVPQVPVSEKPAETVKPEPAKESKTVSAKPSTKAAKVAESAEPDDDLTTIEGIGPKIAATLHAAGITRFAQLAQMKAEDIEKIVKGAGVRMVGKAETFPTQAQLAAEGKWDELKKLTDQLRSGRVVHDDEK